MPQHNVFNALNSLKRNLKPGDIINIDGYDKILEPWNIVTHKCVRSHQKHLFGPLSNYHDTHTMMYFGPDKVFSVTAPKTRWETIEKHAENRFTILRYTKKQFTDHDIAIMYNTALKIIDTKYDYGQLLDIAINQILGYDNIIKYKWFDMGKKRMVCSVGCRTIMEDLRHQQEIEGTIAIERLFNKLNEMHWTQHQIDEFTRVDVECTSPGHFSNTNWFDREYTIQLMWQMFL